MATLEVRVFGDPVLRQRAHEVEDFDGRLAALADDLTETMHAYNGVGLAANQVGVLKRVFSWEVPGDEERPPVGGAVVNPVLLDSSEDVQDGDEGCLSFPGLFYPLSRPLRVQVAYQQVDGDERKVDLEGFAARVWLHEMDHLDGILFVDHLAKHDKQEALRLMREYRLEHELDEAPAAPGSLLLGRRSL